MLRCLCWIRKNVLACLLYYFSLIFCFLFVLTCSRTTLLGEPPGDHPAGVILLPDVINDRWRAAR